MCMCMYLGEREKKDGNKRGLPKGERATAESGGMLHWTGRNENDNEARVYSE